MTVFSPRNELCLERDSVITHPTGSVTVSVAPRRQIVRVLYEARAESAAVPTVWESADQLADSRLQQQRAVQLLEEQRPRVLAAVQRGRDLSRDLSRAPALLPEALEQLELVWAESNAEVIQRLDSATGEPRPAGVSDACNETTQMSGR